MIKMKFSKSQSSVEFFALAGVSFIVVILFVAASASEMKEFSNNREFIMVKDLALKIQKEVSIASSVEDGFKREFTLPETFDDGANGVQYTISNNEKTATVFSSKMVFAVAIHTVIGNFTKGTNTIEKIDGKIYLNR